MIDEGPATDDRRPTTTQRSSFMRGPSSFVARHSSFGLPILALVGALLFTTLILLLTGTPPLEAYQLIIFGALRRPARISDAIMLAAPLVLCATGLTLSFAAGLYNLGVEGQMALGAVFALAVVRWLVDVPPPLIWVLAFGAGALGGALWALIA